MDSSSSLGTAMKIRVIDPNPLFLRAARTFICALLLLAAVALPAAAGERVRVGLYENSPKIALSASGKPEGIFVDLIEAIAEKEDWDLEYVPGTWREGLARLAEGKIDLMPDVAQTTEREQLYAFHREPVISSWNQIYARRGSGIRSLLDLNGKRVAVLEGSTQQELFMHMVAGFSLSVTLLPQPDFAAAFRAVAEGRTDAVVTNRFYGIRHAMAAGLEDTAIIFNPSRLFFAAPKGGNPARLAAIDRHLAAFKTDSTSVYFRSLRHWTTDETPPAVPQWLTFAALAGLALLVAAAVWLILLRRLVAARTATIRRSNEQIVSVNQSLRESERKYRELVENANSIILRWSHDGRIVFLNEFGQRFFGYTEEEIRGRNVIGTIAPETESGGGSMPLMEEICGNPAAFEQNINENMRRGGEHVWIAWTNKVVLDPQGRVAEILSIGTDITARKQMEEELRTTQASLEQRVALRTQELAEREALTRSLAEEQELLLQNVQVGVLFTADGKILRVNPKFAEIFGYADPAELPGADAGVLFPGEEEYGRFAAAAGKVLDEGGVLDVELNGVRRDGGVFLGHTIARAIQVPGYRRASIWMVEDITSRKAAEREIAELTAFLRVLIDHIPNPVFYKDAELRYIGCNRAYEQAFGVQRAHLVGKTVLELEYLPIVERHRYHDEQLHVLAESSTLHREAAIRFADGRVHQTLFSASGFRRADGSPGGVVAMFVDITALKETEAALAEAKHAAEAADRLKSVFLATMSHELRTPLNSIIGFTGLVLQELPGPLNDEQKKQLGMVRDSARHLLALINDVLDISKIEAGELTVAAEPFDLAASIARVAASVEPLAEKKGLALAVTIADSVGAMVGAMVGDERRFEQILINLLSNAIKFTESGQVRLEASAVADFRPESAAAPVPAVRVRVTDTGMGIKPEDMALLFMPFRQIDSSLSRNHEGTGLGLAICRRLAGLMGGIIEAESRWGEGSVFSLTLPLRARTLTEMS